MTIQDTHGCQHANDRDNRPLRHGEQADWDLFCGRDATEWKLPDKTTGFYCAEHGPKVVERNAKRHRLKTVKRCEANAVRGTGTGSCDQPLDEHGNCPRTSDHIE